MKTRQFAALALVMTLFAGFLLGGCKKGDDNGGSLPGNKNMKFTMTTTGLKATDNFSITMAGSDAQGTATTVFKVNGVVQNNQRAITISQQTLMAGPVVVESATPLYSAAISAGGFSSGGSFNFKLEPVIDGSAKTTINETVTTAVFAKEYSY